MRIDGFSANFPLAERSPRDGEVVPYREVQADAQRRREQPTGVSASQGLDLTPLLRRAEAANASVSGSLQYQRPLTTQASQALASYERTANLPTEPDLEILGLDLYA